MDYKKIVILLELIITAPEEFLERSERFNKESSKLDSKHREVEGSPLDKSCIMKPSSKIWLGLFCGSL